MWFCFSPSLVLVLRNNLILFIYMVFRGWRVSIDGNIRGVALKKPEILYWKQSENWNVSFTVVLSPISTPLQANFPLLRAVLQVFLCYFIQELHRFCFQSANLKLVLLSENSSFGKRKKLHGAMYGEYSGYSITRCCSLPNTSSQMMHFVPLSARCPAEESIFSHVWSLSSHTLMEGIQNIFIINLINSLIFGHQINVDKLRI